MICAGFGDCEIHLTQTAHALLRVCELCQRTIWEDVKPQCLGQFQSYKGHICPRVQCNNEMLAGEDHFDRQAWVWY